MPLNNISNAFNFILHMILIENEGILLVFIYIYVYMELKILYIIIIIAIQTFINDCFTA